MEGRCSIRVIPISVMSARFAAMGRYARALFAALAELRRIAPECAARLRFNFVGTSNHPDDTSTYRFRPIAEAAGVGDLVVETPQRIPYLDALDVLANSNVILLLGSGRAALYRIEDLSRAHVGPAFPVIVS